MLCNLTFFLEYILFVIVIVMKNINKTLTTFIGRTFIYLSIFIAGSAIAEVLVRFIKPATWSNASIAITLSILVTFMLTGALFACERHTRSRLTSAATLLVLGFIALRIGHSFVPDPYLLVTALGAAAIGAQPALHRKLTSIKQTVLYSLLTVFISLVMVFSFSYGMTVLNRIAIEQQYGK